MTSGGEYRITDQTSEGAWEAIGDVVRTLGSRARYPRALTRNEKASTSKLCPAASLVEADSSEAAASRKVTGPAAASTRAEPLGATGRERMKS